MTTPAQDQDIFGGKKYIIAGPHEGYAKISVASDVGLGDTVEISDDDGSSLPYFNKIGANGEVVRRRVIIDIKKTKLVEIKQKTTAASLAPSFSITVDNGTTTFTVGKELTADQVSAVFKAAGL